MDNNQNLETAVETNETVEEKVEATEVPEEAVENTAPIEEAPAEEAPVETAVAPVAEENVEAPVAETLTAEEVKEEPAAPVTPAPVFQKPALKHATNRGLLKMIFFPMLTFGIYSIVTYSQIADEINMVASRYDGRKTLPFCAMLILSPFTLFILPLVWICKLCNRMGKELKRRGINYKFGAGKFWLWNVLGSFIFVGPFIFIHKFMKAMNLINRDYNAKG